MTTGRQRPLSTLAQSALAYGQRGFRVFPLTPQGKMPLDMCDECLATLPRWEGSTKGERTKTCRACGVVHEEKEKQRGVHLATTDAAQIERWWRHVPDANIGVATGDGLLVLDIDGDEGEAALSALEAEHGTLPETPRQITGKGRHYLFRVDKTFTNSAQRVGKHIDTRCDGGYIVICPSIHPNGDKYSWDGDNRPSRIKIADAPAWLLKLLVKEVAQRPQITPHLSTPSLGDGPSAKWVEAVINRELESTATCSEGGRNSRLFQSATRLAELCAGGHLSESVARSQLADAGRQCGLPDAEVQQCITNGWAQGIAAPREIPAHVVQADQEWLQRREQKTMAASVSAGGRRSIRMATVDGAPVEEGDAEHVFLPSVWVDKHPPEGWVLTSEGGKAKKSMTNMMLHLRHEHALVDLFALDEISETVLLTRSTPWHSQLDKYPRALRDSDILGLVCHLESRTLTPSPTMAKDCIRLAAEENVINPIRDRLESLEWDGTERIDYWLADYLGVDDTSFSRQAGAKWLISGVARIMRPGCKVDSMLVLEGPQGARKSSVFATLAGALGEHCFTDRLSNLVVKDAAIELLGNVIIEIAELEAFTYAQVSTIKAFLSRQTDKIRLPWDRTTTELKRACVFGGTVNPGGVGWMSDETGGRRFWPVAVGSIDIAGLNDVASLLWAEAMHRFKSGEEWWITDDVVIKEHHAAIAERYDEDAWAPLIDDYITGKDTVRVDTILTEALSFTVDRIDERAKRRIGRHLVRRGFNGKTIRICGKPCWGFRRDEPWFPES